MKHEINFLSVLKAETLKLILLKIPQRVFFLNIVFIGILIGLSLKFSGSSEEVAYTMELHKSISGILVFYSRFILLFVVSASICTNFGSEFEWKTIHQYIIKGLSSELMVLSKLIIYYIHFVIQYLAYTSIVLLGYFLFSPVGLNETALSIPWIEILSLPIGILLMVSISILSVGISFSSSKSLIFNFLYYVFIEMFLRGFIFIFYRISGLPIMESAGEYLPYKSFLMIQSENPDFWVFVPIPILYSMVFVGFTIMNLRKKEYALVNV